MRAALILLAEPARGQSWPGQSELAKKERAQGPFFMLPMHRASGNQNASVLSL